MKIKIVYTFILIIYVISPSSGQFKFDFHGKDIRSEYSLQVWTKNDGLPSNTLHNIVKGKTAFSG